MTIACLFTEMAPSLFPDILEAGHPMHGPLSWHHLWFLYQLPEAPITKCHRLEGLNQQNSSLTQF